MKYTITSGYYAKDGDNYRKEFFEIWYLNTIKHSKPEDIYVFNNSSNPFKGFEFKVNWIDHKYNLGHVCGPNNGFKFGGWSMSIIQGALIAYSNNTDWIFKEQDCLAFGNWVDDIYIQVNEEKARMIFGKCKIMPVEQSLIFVKHDFILDFVTAYLSHPNTDWEICPEQKFKDLEYKFPKEIKRLRFGYGRDRPYRITDQSWYIQQPTQEEMRHLREMGMI